MISAIKEQRAGFGEFKKKAVNTKEHDGEGKEVRQGDETMEHAEILKNRAARAAHPYLRSNVPLNYIPTQFHDHYLQPGKGRV